MKPEKPGKYLLYGKQVQVESIGQTGRLVIEYGTVSVARKDGSAWVADYPENAWAAIPSRPEIVRACRSHICHVTTDALTDIPGGDNRIRVLCGRTLADYVVEPDALSSELVECGMCNRLGDYFVTITTRNAAEVAASESSPPADVPEAWVGFLVPRLVGLLGQIGAEPVWDGRRLRAEVPHDGQVLRFEIVPVPPAADD